MKLELIVLAVIAVFVAVFAFGLNFAAYVSEMFRTGIEGVDRGQTEAGVAMGFTKLQTFIHIVLPQAGKRILPVYKGEIMPKGEAQAALPGPVLVMLGRVFGERVSEQAVTPAESHGRPQPGSATESCAETIAGRAACCGPDRDRSSSLRSPF